MPSCSFCNDTRRSSGCPMCDPSAVPPPIPGKKAKAARRPVARVAAPLPPPLPTRTPIAPPAASQAPQWVIRPAAPVPLASLAPVAWNAPDVRADGSPGSPIVPFSPKASRFPSKCPDCSQRIEAGASIKVATVRKVLSVHAGCAFRVPAEVARELSKVGDAPIVVPPAAPRVTPITVPIPTPRAPAPPPAAVAVTVFPQAGLMSPPKSPKFGSGPDWRERLARAGESRTTAAAPAEDEKTQVDPLRSELAVGDWRGLWERHAAGMLSDHEARAVAASWKSGASA